ncbi:MAG: glycosyl transferase group 1 [Frankiales bacterium]|nr:glycosyl transferase group 1 [Frankiales bacterium]
MIVVLCNESPWPVRNGGRVRLDGLIAALREQHEVRVVVAVGAGSDAVSSDAIALPVAGRSRLGAVAGAGPFLGRRLLDRDSGAVLQTLCEGAAALVVSHSYLAPELPPLAVPVVLDLQNLEVHRQAASGTALGRLEALKARRWEPRAVAEAWACVCVDEADASVVRGWGASDVVVVPNAAQVPTGPPSPRDGPVLAVADWRYGPNADGLRLLVHEVAPRLGHELVVAGRGSELVPGGLGFVEDLTALYDEAAVVVSPVVRGAGTQLKIIEALTRGRVVVTTTYGARSVPAAAHQGCVIADGPEALASALRLLVADVTDRHRREAVLRAAPLPRSWTAAAAPLTDLLAGVAGG